MVRLTQLVEQLGGTCPLGGSGPDVKDVQLDSRRVETGHMFAALPGSSADGARFLTDAAARGAVAVLTPHGLDLRTVNLDLPGLDVAQWVHPDARRVAGLSASLIQGRPADDLAIVGVTGTNGKTTTSHVLGHLLDVAGLEPAVLGTAGHRVAGGRRLDASHTTPDAPELHRLLREHRDSGGASVVMEVSSHALAQERTAGIEFSVAIFTNLSREHLDYHVDMDCYAAAKARLFEQLGSLSGAVLNIDDPAWASMAEAARRSGARVVTYSTRGRADVRAVRLRPDSQGTCFRVEGMGIFSVDVRLPLRGRYNVENALAAAAAARLLGASPADVIEGLATASAAPGRLEPIPTRGRGFDLYIDYAHSPDALECVLRSLRDDMDGAGVGGRLILVFGCGGDRDVGKRPQMGAVASRGADVAIVTNDNPRSEDPVAIAEDIVSGMAAGDAECEVVLDRRLAIERAIGLARAGDVVVVAGKGHENHQIVGEHVIAFDDRVVAQEALA